MVHFFLGLHQVLYFSTISILIITLHHSNSCLRYILSKDSIFFFRYFSIHSFGHSASYQFPTFPETTPVDFFLASLPSNKGMISQSYNLINSLHANSIHYIQKVIYSVLSPFLISLFKTKLNSMKNDPLRSLYQNSTS